MTLWSWDKSAEIYFKNQPGENLYADFIYSTIEVEDILRRVTNENEIEITKITQLTNQDRSIVYCEVRKTIYIAEKAFFKEKRD